MGKKTTTTGQTITGPTIRAIRSGLGQTQEDFAAEIGVSPITVSRWERGVSAIPATTQRMMRSRFARHLPEEG